MGRLSITTQELANFFPEWSVLRTDPDSNGQRLLNCFAKELEDLEEAVFKIGKNMHLSTCNALEIDQLYKIRLGQTFKFNESDTVGGDYNYEPPNSITGTLSLGSISAEENQTGNSNTVKDIEIVRDGSISTFWEKSLPDSARRAQQVAVSGDTELQVLIKDLDALSEIAHPLKDKTGGGHFHFTLVAGNPYFFASGEGLSRARIVITGITRKGLEESETLVFPWESRIKTIKQWAVIKTITAFDVKDKVIKPQKKTDQPKNDWPDSYLIIHRDDCLQDEYISFYNSRYSMNRKKIDEFWGLLTNSSTGNKDILERAEYISEDWKMLLRGNTEKESKSRWLLLDKDGQGIDAIDLKLIPFKRQCWVLTSNFLYLYDIDILLNTRLVDLKDNPGQKNIDIVSDNFDVLKGEQLKFSIFNKSLLKEIIEYTIWYKLPDSSSKLNIKTESTTVSDNRLLDTVMLDISSNGEYILGVTVTFSDMSTETVTKIVKAKSKKPLKSFSLDTLTGLNTSNPTGIFLDSDQKLWIKTNTHYYEIEFCKNIALIDYKKKIVYLHEKYQSVAIDYPDPT